MLIGYARCSTNDQNLDLQLDALRKAGCERIFKDVLSGAIDDRPGLQQAQDFLNSGDVLVVWKMDRLGRSLPHLIQTVSSLANRGVGLKSLTESLDTSSAGGRLVLHIFGALAEFERDLIRQRTVAGLQAARERGRIGGRRPKMSDSQNIIAQQLFNERHHTVGEIAKSLNVSRSTIYRNLKIIKPNSPQGNNSV